MGACDLAELCAAMADTVERAAIIVAYRGATHNHAVT